MPTSLRLLSGLPLAALLVVGAAPAPTPTPQAVLPVQPMLAADAGPLLTIQGLRFRDLNRDGRLDPYEDWRLPIARRVGDLVGRMTLEEKAGTMMHGSLAAVDSSVGASQIGYDMKAAEAQITGQKITSFITRLAVAPVRMAEQNNAIQAIAARGRLGIPITISTDPRHHFQAVLGASGETRGYSQWPETLGFAALRDPALMRRFATVARQEYRATGIHQALSPQADLFTDPRWSRGTGTFGANAALARAMVEAYVTGFQGSDTGLVRDGVSTVVKHWVGYGANPEGFDGHNYYGRIARLDNAALETHILPFTGAFQAGVSGVMPTYDILEGPSIEGRPLEAVGAGFNAQLLGLLRQRYGFQGMVLSDWGITRDCTAACRDPKVPHTPMEIAMPWGVEQLSPAQRYAKGVNAGIDQFGGVMEPEMIVAGVRSGAISQARVDEAVARILAIKFQLGLFENPMVDPAAAARINPPEVQREALAAQAASQVLLKNVGGLLPLKPGTRVWLKGIDPAVVRAHGLEPAATMAQAQVAILRTETPFERLHPLHFFGSRQHEGRLDFRPGDADYDAVATAAERMPVVMALFLDRPAILTAIAPKAQAILGNFGVSDAALLDAITGRVPPRGRLPFELPSSMAAVAAQDPAKGDDSAAPLFPYGAGE